MYEPFDHTADVGLRVTAPNLETLLADAAQGLFSIIAEETVPHGPATPRTFQIPGQPQRPDWLLFDWLNELLYVFDTENLLLSDFAVHQLPAGFEATAQARPLDPATDRLLHEVKAITYHALKVEHVAGLWRAELVLDI